MNKKIHLIHGGNLALAARQYSRPIDEWLDLSTGISPWSYPVPEIPQKVWQRLPDDNKKLVQAAVNYYGVASDYITSVPGSQYAIQHLPRFFSQADVAIPEVGYQEHYRCWSMSGHKVYCYDSWDTLYQLVSTGNVKHVVVIHPNNPGAEKLPYDVLEKILGKLQGYCVIDEAFIDLVPKKSFVKRLQQTENKKIIILRSIGKFFGLAGLRLGFVLGRGEVVECLREELDPWGVNHAALFFGEKVLQDSLWRQQQRNRIQQQSDEILCRLSHYLKNHKSIDSIASTGLFITLFGHKDFMVNLYESAAQQGILMRYDNLSHYKSWLRIGLPGEHWPRLQTFFQDFFGK